MNGNKVKNYIKSQGVCLWQVAEALGVNDGNFSRRLRKPFTTEEFNKIAGVVSEIKAFSQITPSTK